MSENGIDNTFYKGGAMVLPPVGPSAWKMLRPNSKHWCPQQLRWGLLLVWVVSRGAEGRGGVRSQTWKINNFEGFYQILGIIIPQMHLSAVQRTEHPGLLRVHIDTFDPLTTGQKLLLHFLLKRTLVWWKKGCDQRWHWASIWSNKFPAWCTLSIQSVRTDLK